MFKVINNINDIKPFVEHKKEISFTRHWLRPGIYCFIGCYNYQDDKTFDSIESLECRGIIFGADGNVVSRPLHKFFNIAEKNTTLEEQLLRDDLDNQRIKLDGSLIATAYINGRSYLRSRKSFESDVVRLANKFMFQTCSTDNLPE